jgi:hypothetical protein
VRAQRILSKKLPEPKPEVVGPPTHLLPSNSIDGLLLRSATRKITIDGLLLLRLLWLLLLFLSVLLLLIFIVLGVVEVEVIVVVVL